MSIALEPRPLADLWQDAIASVEQEWARRARGVKPWTNAEYVEQIERVHARYAFWTQWLKNNGRAAS